MRWTYVVLFLILFITGIWGSNRHERCTQCGNATASIKWGVVDIFLLTSNPTNEYGYINDGSFIANPLLIRHLGQKDTRVHIFSGTDSILSYAKSFGFIVHDTRNYSTLEHNFFDMYSKNHHSINTVNYEFLCFYRWLLFSQAAKHWQANNPLQPKIDRIITMDSDVLTFWNARILFENILRVHLQENYEPDDVGVANGVRDFELLVLSPGAFHFWSYHGLRTYAHYIYDWYNNTPEAITERTKHHAGYLYGTLHFSDMNMIVAFTKENVTTRNMCLTDVSNTPRAKRTAFHDCVVETLGCVPVGRYDSIIPGHTLFYNGTKKHYYGDGEKYPFCFMHLQGDVAKTYYHFLGRFMLTVHDIPRPQNMQKPYLIQQNRDREVFFLSNNGTRHSIPNWDTFLYFNFSVDMIFSRLTWEIMTGIPVGPPIAMGKPLPLNG